MKKETLLSILLWGIVAYSVAILSYFTLKVIFKHDSSYISAFGAILSACATFFAAYVATQLYNNWKEQHNYTSLKDYSLQILHTFTDINIKLVSINDVFVKSLKKNKIAQNTYDASKIADDIEDEIKYLGDKFTEMLHQINFLGKLNNETLSNPVLNLMHNLLIDYIEIMDISYYRKINDHNIFSQKESHLKVQWENLDTEFCNYLKKYIVLNDI